MGILYIIYRRDVSGGLIGDLCQGGICKIQGTNENHIGLRPKVYSSILGSLYSKTRNLDGDFNSLLLIDGWTNKEAKPNVKTVFIILRQLRTKKLGIVVTSYIVCV